MDPLVLQVWRIYLIIMDCVIINFSILELIGPPGQDGKNGRDGVINNLKIQTTVAPR